jgi:hypothetical protein
VPTDVTVEFGPCCFCSRQIESSNVDPCRVTVETAQSKWQVWYCHADCFRTRLADLPDHPGFFDPAHF